MRDCSRLFSWSGALVGVLSLHGCSEVVMPQSLPRC